MKHATLAFIGGGNMASAILGGLRGAGRPADAFVVVEPWQEQRERLAAAFGIEALPVPAKRLREAAAGGLGRQTAAVRRARHAPPRPTSATRCSCPSWPA
jgi:3-hydroxyisobutyrate dehydrogenase-like beta-hydroxyacid dehydrogenase